MTHLDMGKQVFRSLITILSHSSALLLERTGIMEDARFNGKILLKPKL